MILTGILVWFLMPGMMLVVEQSRYNSIEETCKQLQATVETNNWKVSEIRNMNKAISKQGLELNRQVKIIELCNAKYAQDILNTNPEISTLMPLAWGVYEGEDSKIYISRLNVGLLGKMFGGNIAKVMGGAVANEEKTILRDIF